MDRGAGGRRRKKYLCPLFFTAKLGRKNNPTNVFLKIDLYSISHTAAVLRHTNSLSGSEAHSSILPWPPNKGGLITKPLKIDRDPTKTRSMTDYGK
jgi:hypothetical protein